MKWLKSFLEDVYLKGMDPFIQKGVVLVFIGVLLVLLIMNKPLWMLLWFFSGGLILPIVFYPFKWFQVLQKRFLLFQSGDSYDAVPEPSPGALTLKTTMRAAYGATTEVYITGVYRWREVEFPVAQYLAERAVEFGRRMGGNEFIIASAGDEEQYWNDTVHFCNGVNKSTGTTIRLQDYATYLFVCGVPPRTMSRRKAPFLLLDITNLGPEQITGLFSKLLDMFNSGFRDDRRYEYSPGKSLLDGNPPEDTGVIQALKQLAEISIVLQDMNLQFIRFPQNVSAAFETEVTRIEQDLDRATYFAGIRTKLRKQQISSTWVKGPTSVPKSRLWAYSLYKKAKDLDPTNEDEAKAYKFIKENLIEDDEDWNVTLETFQRYLREMRRVIGEAKNSSRKGRADGSRSIVRGEDQ